MGLRVYLTGHVAVEVDGRVVVHERQFRRRQTRLVFAYLVCERAAPTPRERLADVVWGGEPPPAWEVALSALASRLRHLLATSGLSRLGVALPHDPRYYQLRLPPDAWVDLEVCANAVDQAEGALRTGTYERVLGPAFVAATLARRPFLAGEHGHWAEGQRRRLERYLLRALDCLIRLWLTSGEPSLAVEAATEALGHDPYREVTHQHLMRAYAALGERARALQAYTRLRELLREELGLSPTPETEALYLELLQ